MLDIHAGFGFSAGFIDYIINYKLATNPLLILPLGAVFAFIYFFASYYTIKVFKLKIFEEDTQTIRIEEDEEAQAFIDALGGKKNIVDTDACITRLRMHVHDSTMIKDASFSTLGAKGVIPPNKHSIQIVLGTKAENVAEKMKTLLQ